jgi:uncharacterized protein
MAMKTPGVYIVEKNAFPPSVVEVATAVPAFIGYTDFARNGGNSLHNKPWRISSMSEYARYFGGPPKPVFKLEVVPNPEPAAGNKPSPTDARGQKSDFTFGGKTYRLSRSAKKAGGRYLMHQAMTHFFQNGGGACYIVSVGDYTKEIEAGDEGKDLIGGLTPLVKEQEPTMVLMPDAVLLSQADCILAQQQMLAHCGGKMRNRVAILDIWGGDRDRKDAEFGWSCIDEFRNDIGINHLDFSSAYYPWLHTSLVPASALDYGIFGTEITNLTTMLLADLGLSDDAVVSADPKLKARADAIKSMLTTDEKWVENLIAALKDDKKVVDKAKEEADIKRRAADPDMKRALLAPSKDLVQKSVLTMSSLYEHALKEAREMINLMPPSAAMAGLYTMVDNSRGVWKAPANVSVANVVRPAVEISHEDQEDLNVTTQGKSINAIRSFIGEGALVWGARTLDGNSLDWRYISVRRTMIMLEESCRLAAKAMVFEPNVGNTWVTIKSMISNFLVGIWKRGGLAGAVPDDAFSVHVGLGETMTSEDILEGILRVTVLVAISRPAEFIEITFQQQMQKS